MATKARVRVTAITISREQLHEARARVEAAGVGDLVDIELCDYRHVKGKFDKVVSIEMLEAVGADHLASFFSAVSRALKPGGIAAIQVVICLRVSCYTTSYAAAQRSAPPQSAPHQNARCHATPPRIVIVMQE